MRHPWVNVTLLILLILQLITGFFSLLTGSAGGRWVVWTHDVGGWAIVVLLGWKAAVVLDSLARRRKAPPERHIYLILSALLVATLLSGLIWTSAGRIVIAGYSLLTIHMVLAIAVMVLLVSHALYMRFIFGVPGAADRRAFLRMGATAIGGVAVWQLSVIGKALINLPGAARRFTGSYETGSFTGRFPTVSWFSDDPDRVNRETWRLSIGGAVRQPIELSYDDLMAYREKKETALIDCTGGWFSKQDWGGVSVATLLAV